MTEQDNNSIKPEAFNRNEPIKPAAFAPLSKKDLKKKKRLRFTSVVTGLFLLLGLGILWFVFTAKSLYLEIDPQQALVTVKGGLHFKLADRYLIHPGSYEIHVEALGYYPLAETIKINKQQNQHFPFSLRRLPGHLKVITNPVVDAEVWLNNELKGMTNGLITNLPHAEYSLKILSGRYLPFEETIEIEGRDQEQFHEVTLLPGWAEVSLGSTPTNADIFVDDELIGQTPMLAEIMQGAHNIRVKLSRYKAWQDDIKITASEAMTLEDIFLLPADAIVSLQTIPSKASVTIDGEYRGLTPLEVALQPGETVDIRFFKQGYQRSSRRLKLASGDEEQLSVKLNSELTPIRVSSIPPDAELYIDGILRGRASQELELPTRPHKIEIRREGYVSYATTITPRIGVDQNIKISLKTLRQAKIDAIKPLIKTTAGQTLKLFYPGRFTMGASRREAGRRANEALRNINLTRPFYLSLKEVSNTEFRLFKKGHSSGEVKANDLDGGLQPVVNIRWVQAALYCNWLSKQEKLESFYIEQDGKILGFNDRSFGYRLPTEAEWAWAARMVRNGQLLKYPWGDSMPPAKNSGNFADDSSAHLLGRILNGFDDGHATSAAIGYFQPNSKGLYDMGGNVSEWIHDFYNIAVGRSNILETDPMGAASGSGSEERHVIRGSSWAHGSITELRYSWRNYGSEGQDDVGFRIARFLDL